MSSLERPSKQCTRAGCRTDTLPGTARCATHTRAAWTGSKTANDKAAHRLRYGAHYQRRREFVVRRDCYSCVVCGAPQKLQVHHLDESGRVEALVTLCVPCHRKAEADNRAGGGKTLKAIANYMRSVQRD
jgi:5-methylcytosine-specific restriction endonuclease McrA